MQIRPTAFTIGLIIYSFITLFAVYTEFGIDSKLPKIRQHRLVVPKTVGSNPISHPHEISTSEFSEVLFSFFSKIFSNINAF